MPAIGTMWRGWSAAQSDGGSRDCLRRSHHWRRLSSPLWRTACRGECHKQRKGKRPPKPQHHLCQSGTLCSLRQDATLCRPHHRDRHQAGRHWLHRPICEGQRLGNQETAGGWMRSASWSTRTGVPRTEPPLLYLSREAQTLDHPEVGAKQ